MKNVIWLVSLFLSTTAMTDEGMWLPQQLPELETQLKAKGLKVDTASIAKLTEFPMNTVVSLGGCSGAFVSAQGLVVTNHHCAYGSVQYHSSEQQNLLSNGFLAATLQDELPAVPGSKILLTQQIDNVTRQIQQELTPQLLGRDRFDKIEQLRKELVDACETAAGYRCTLYSFDGGLAYYLVKQLEITDVRLVHAPAEGVGKFGGDIDNWMWPRHTGDYAFYRAYVGKDGKPAAYQADNIPFQPPAFLKVSAKGVQADDFVMVIGYPGRTYRHLTAAELKLHFDNILPLTQLYRSQTIRIIEQTTADNSALRLQYQSILASLRNRNKNTASLLQSYQQTHLQQRKDQQQLALLQWLKAEPGRQARYLPALLDLESWIVQQKTSLERDTLMQAFDSIQLFSAARQLYRNAQEQTKPDSEREIGYQLREQLSFTATLQRLSRTLAPAVEVELAWFFLQQYHQLAPADRVPLLDQYFNLTAGTALNEQALQQLKQQLNELYQKTELTDPKQLLHWQQQPLSAFAQSQDPMLQLAIALYPDELAREQRQKTLAGKTAQLKPQVMAAWQAFKRSQQQQVYPDANGSLRVSFGTVQGYQPRDGVYFTPFSSVQGIAAKATGVVPFAAPAAQLQAIAQSDFTGYASTTLGTLPVNFLSTADTTGGNSGSATLNGQAELVGLLFDGVSESIIGDYDYDPALNRSIHVDSRYMLWQMDKVDGAARLLQEMVIVR
jgi:hypothetical protein